MTNKVSCLCHTCEQNFTLCVGEVNRKNKLGTKFYCSLSCAAKQPKQNPSAYNKSEANKKHLKSICGNKKDSLSPFRELAKRARVRKHTCNITPDYLKGLWEEQGGKCAWTGLPLVLPLTTGKEDKSNPNLVASLDRVDSSKGYVEGNCQFVCLSLNYAKNNNPDWVVLNLIQLIRESA